MMELNYHTNGKNWDKTFATSAYNPYDFILMMDPKLRKEEGRLNCASFDDLQASCPAEAGVPKAIRRMASYLSTSRPEVACIVSTADNMNGIAAPLRKLMMFEIIVAHRGEYEVQKISYHKNYRKPLQDLGKLDYLEEGKFPALPEEQQRRYELWRAKEKMKLYPQLKAELLAYAKLKNWSIDDLTNGAGVSLNIPVTKNGRDFVLRLPQELGEKFFKENLHVALAKE